MIRPLVIDDSAKERISTVVGYAESHKFSKAVLLRRMKENTEPPGDNPNFRCQLDVGFVCVYTIEEQPIGLCHHLSVSVDSPNKFPSIPAIEMIMSEFGMYYKINDENVRVYIEEESESVNIIAPKR